MSAGLTLCGIDLEQCPITGSYGGQRGPVHVRVLPLAAVGRWVAYAMLDRHAGERPDPSDALVSTRYAELAVGYAATLEDAIERCEQDARERSDALLTLLQPGADWLRSDDVVEEPEPGTIDAALREVCS